VISDFSKFCLTIDQEFSFIVSKLKLVKDAMGAIMQNSDSWKQFTLKDDEAQRAAHKAQMN